MKLSNEKLNIFQKSKSTKFCTLEAKATSHQFHLNVSDQLELILNA